MKALKLKNHPYAQCHVDIEDNAIIFWSYRTPVIQIKEENGKRIIGCSGTYSQTTRRQISWFLREYAPDLNYYDMKNIVGMGLVEM